MNPEQPDTQASDMPQVEVVAGGAATPDSKTHLLRKVNRVYLIALGGAFLLALPLVLTYISAANDAGTGEGAGLFGIVLLFSLLAILGVGLFMAIVFSWPTTVFFLKYFKPKNRYWLAAVWAVLAVGVAGAIYLTIEYAQFAAALSRQLRALGTISGMAGVGAVLGLAVTPYVLLVSLFLDKTSPQKTRRIVYGAFAAGAIVLVFVGVINHKANEQWTTRLLSSIYIPREGSDEKLTFLRQYEFDIDGPPAILSNVSDHQLRQAIPLAPGVTQDSVSGLCVPARYVPPQEDRYHYDCEYTFTTPNGVRVYEEKDKEDQSYNHYFTIGSTFFGLRSYQDRENIIQIIDSLVPAQPMTPAQARVNRFDGDFSERIKPLSD